jgi:hypothetical protein
MGIARVEHNTLNANMAKYANPINVFNVHQYTRHVKIA